MEVTNGLTTAPTPAEALSDRRADIDGKQARVAALLQELGCDGLLLLEPENLAWVTSGAAARGVHDPGEQPAVYVTAEQRWLLASNADAQRFFDEELDGLGFQLKEWPWYWGRAQLLADLCDGRKVAADAPCGNARAIPDALKRLRRSLTTYEQACLGVLGQLVGHAVEAACRTLNRGESEREVAGQLAHRLMHRGVIPVAVEVAADGRSRRYRQCGFTNTPVTHYGVLTATGKKYGLCATASRSVCFGEADPVFRREHDAACKVGATYLASSWPDAVPSQILNTGRRVYLVTGYEHEWRLGPQGHVTGRAPVELPLLPDTSDLLQPGWAVTWRAGVGAASSCDTYLISESGPVLLTPWETWPAKRIRVQGADFFRPDVLYRELGE